MKTILKVYLGDVMTELETNFNRLKAYDPNDSIELYISSKLLGVKNIKSYDDIGLKYNRFNDRKPINSDLIGSLESLYTNSMEEWLEHRQKVMTTYVSLIGCKERLIQKEIELERSLF